MGLKSASEVAHCAAIILDVTVYIESHLISSHYYLSRVLDYKLLKKHFHVTFGERGVGKCAFLCHLQFKRSHASVNLECSCRLNRCQGENQKQQPPCNEGRRAVSRDHRCADASESGGVVQWIERELELVADSGVIRYEGSSCDSTPQEELFWKWWYSNLDTFHFQFQFRIRPLESVQCSVRELLRCCHSHLSSVAIPSPAWTFSTYVRVNFNQLINNFSGPQNVSCACRCTSRLLSKGPTCYLQHHSDGMNKIYECMYSYILIWPSILLRYLSEWRHCCWYY